MQFVSQEEVNSIIASATTDLTERGLLRQIIKYESPSANLDGASGYFIEMEGTFKGLGQFSQSTWKLLQAQGFPYSYKYVGTPKADVLATLALLRDSRRYFRNKFNYDFVKENDFEIAYLMHNQGAPAASSFIETGVISAPGQSVAAITLFKGINRGKFS